MYYSVMTPANLEKEIPSAPIRSRTYDLPITSSDALPLRNRRFVGAKATKPCLLTLKCMLRHSSSQATSAMGGIPFPDQGAFFSKLKFRVFCYSKTGIRIARVPISGHPRDQKKCLFKRGVRLWEVKNVVFVCS